MRTFRLDLNCFENFEEREHMLLFILKIVEFIFFQKKKKMIDEEVQVNFTLEEEEDISPRKKAKIIFYEQPRTLMSIAAKNVPSKNEIINRKIVPVMFEEDVVINMNRNELVEYFEHSDHNLDQIAKQFSVTGIQNLVFHILLLMQDPDIPKKINVTLSKQIFRLEKWTMFEMSSLWIMLSLGIQCIYFQLVENEKSVVATYQRSFFNSFFNEWSGGTSYTIGAPCLPVWFKKKRKMTEKNARRRLDFKYEDHLKQVQTEKAQSTLDHFFELLIGMNQCYTFSRHRRVAMYAIELLDMDKNLMTHNVVSKYFLYIYGMLASTLAKLQYPYKAIVQCIKSMELFVHKGYSPALDYHVLYYRQCVYAYTDNYKFEKKTFKKINQNVPMLSKLWKMSFKVHLKATIMSVENKILEILCSHWIDHSSYYYKLDENTMYLYKIKRVLLHAISKCKIPTFRLEEDMLIIDFYLMLMEILNNGMNEAEKRRKLTIFANMALVLQIKNEHFTYLFDYYFNEGIEIYTEQMETVKTKCQTMESRKWPMTYGEICLSHFVALCVMKTIRSPCSQTVYQLKKAGQIYNKVAKHGRPHSRALILNNLINSQENGKTISRYTYNEYNYHFWHENHEDITKPVSMQKLCSENPSFGKLIFSGFKNIEHTYANRDVQFL